MGMASGSNAGGVNVMTCDLSDDEKYHECPDSNTCTLEKQVAFYMNTYQTAGTAANPDKEHDGDHQLPLSKDKLSTLVSQVQDKYAGGFFWELYKPADGQASPTEVAQALCKKLLPGQSRCSGSIPDVSPSPVPSPTPAPTPSALYKCVSGQCVSASAGVSKETCDAICGPVAI